MLGPSKLNHRLLEALLATPLAADPRLRAGVRRRKPGRRLRYRTHGRHRPAQAGQTHQDHRLDRHRRFRQWLAAADIGVQLRTLSRGETSGTVLDCMNYGLATIVNAKVAWRTCLTMGCQAARPVRRRPSWRRPAALCATIRGAFAQLGRAPATSSGPACAARCADQYAHAIEQAYHESARGPAALIAAMARLDPTLMSEREPAKFAQALAYCLPSRLRLPQRLVEVDPGMRRMAPGRGRAGALPARTVPLVNRVEPVYVARGDSSATRAGWRCSCWTVRPDRWKTKSRTSIRRHIVALARENGGPERR